MNTQWLQWFVLLLFAHLMGDFVLQFNFIQRRKIRWQWNMVHSLMIAALAYLLVADWTLWLFPLVIFVSHMLIDLVKINLKSRPSWVFLVDQLMHWAVLAVLAAIAVNRGLSLPAWLEWQAPLPWIVMVFAVGLILLVPCGGYLIGAFVQPYQEQIEKHYKTLKKTPLRGLKDGGRIIGMLERVLILLFVMVGQYAGIGFLVAAKSIFRFGEFKESENRMEAEYIIIGTFASFLFSILISLGVKSLIGLGG